MIADALREIAAEAGTPGPVAEATWRAGPVADAAWRAGRRRRLAALTASAVTAAAVVAAAVLVPLAAQGGPTHGQPSPPASQQGPAGLIRLRSPIQLRQVASVSPGACPAGSGGLRLPGSGATGCIYLTRHGLTVTTVRSAVVIRTGPGQYVLNLVLTRAQRRPWAALTRHLSHLGIPGDELAVIVEGRVISYPAIDGAITGGSLQIDFATRAQVESVVSSLRIRCAHASGTGSVALVHPGPCE
jgi:hypothetical protein